MKIFKWNLGKNLKLKSKNHIGQKCFMVKLNGKLWVVPFKEGKDAIFLITIYEKD